MKRLRSLFADERGENMIEWIVLVAIMLAVIGPILYTIYQSLQQKLTDVNDGL